MTLRRICSMEEWKEYILGDVSQIKGGKRLPKGVNLITSPNCHPYIRVRDLGTKKTIELNTSFEYVDEETQKSISKYTVEKGDIIISIVGTIGLVAIIGDSLNNANLTENCVKIVNSNTLNREYLYYYLISKFGQDEIKNGTVGAVQAKLPIKNIQDIKVKAPSLSEQTKIASVLKSLDDKIEVNRRINDNLELQAQALFKSWFVDFEPFKDGDFVDSELGMIPKGWSVVSLDNLIVVKYGKDHKKLGEGEIPVYGSGGWMRNVNKSLYKGESVLIPRKGSLNNVMYVNEEFWTVDTMFYTLPIVQDVLLYVYIYLCNKDLASFNAGSAVPSMTTEILNNMRIIMPSHEVLHVFNKKVYTMYEDIKHRDDESHCLAQLRDTLLPRLMSGEIKVGDVTL